MKLIRSLGHVVGGSLLIAGTTIGVGMLALPIATGPSGFFPSLIMYLICWGFMVCTALLLLEVNLSMPPDTGFISMADKFLGPIGRGIFWLAYLFLFVTVMIAHVAGGGSTLKDILNWDIPLWSFSIGYVLLIIPIIYLGTRAVDRINTLLLSGVLLSYFGFIAISYNQIQAKLLIHMDWGRAWGALPILFVAFTYHLILPTLMTYMERNVKKIRLAIFCGSSIPLVIYLIWEFLILGIIPPERLINAGEQGQNAIFPLREFINSPSLFSVGKAFAFFSLTTSFVPLALAFFDFLADGLKVKKEGTGRLALIGAVFGIPTAIALIYPSIFLVALGYAGGISCALLFGLMPPVLAWVSRYLKHHPLDQRQLPGGKPVLVFLVVFSLFILGSEVFS